MIKGNLGPREVTNVDRQPAVLAALLARHSVDTRLPSLGWADSCNICNATPYPRVLKELRIKPALPSSPAHLSPFYPWLSCSGHTGVTIPAPEGACPSQPLSLFAP